MPRLRVILGVRDICHYYSTVTRGFEQIGVDAHFFCLNEDTLDAYARDAKSPVVRLYLTAYRRFLRTRDASRLSVGRYWATFLVMAATLLAVLWIATTANAVIFKSGQSFFQSGIDLHLYNMIGIRVVFIFHGSDSRPPYLNAFYADKPVELLRTWTNNTKAAIERLAGRADYIVDNPASAQFHEEGMCCLYQVFGNPIDEARLHTGGNLSREISELGTVRILHAPSSAALKGTSSIRKCVSQLKQEGFGIEYVELSGVPNSKVIEEIKNADLIIDELYSDIHGATLSMEAIACGRPTIVGGYCFKQLEQVVPQEFIPPIVACNPKDLYSTVKCLLEDRTRLRRLRESCLDFYANVGCAKEVARRFVTLLEGKAPATWFFDVAANKVVGVVAGPPTAVLKNVRKLREHYGDDALRLGRKPELEAQLPQLIARLSG